jgi:hypothetical protein
MYPPRFSDSFRHPVADLVENMLLLAPHPRVRNAGGNDVVTAVRRNICARWQCAEPFIYHGLAWCKCTSWIQPEETRLLTAIGVAD